MIDKIALLHIENRKLLCTLSKGKTLYYIPGGKREQGESDEETLIRESKEELNVDVIPGTYRYYGTYRAQADGKAEGVVVQVTAYFASFKGTPEASSEIDRIDWLSYDDKMKSSLVDHAIFDDLKKDGLID
ncbi:MAG: NUDIX domain-containing protein [Oscillospiraceae bacterium]|nr:NUDIX domain-containing protein [Oscillospiraceae bacterium]